MELIKSNSRFNEIKDVELEFLTRDIQLGGKTTTIRMPIGTAVRDGIVDNETLGYFLARIQLFRTFLFRVQSSSF
jgi:glycyl-tRNA synthetase